MIASTAACHQLPVITQLSGECVLKGPFSTLVVAALLGLSGSGGAFAQWMPATEASVSATNLDFGNKPLSTSSSRQTITLTGPTISTAVGSRDFIDIIAIKLPDVADFAIVGGSCPPVSTDGVIADGYHLGIGQSCTIDIQFRPTSAGGTHSSLSIFSANGSYDPYTCGPGPFGIECFPWAGGIVPLNIWQLTTVTLSGYGVPAPTFHIAPGDVRQSGDFDGDGKLDTVVWRPSNGIWFITRSSDRQITTQQWGLSGDIPVSGDFDGDGKTDMAVWRPSNGTWYIIRSSDGQIVTQQWGLPGDVPIASDFDRDGRAEYAVWRPSNGVWYIIQSSDHRTTTQQWGLPGDIPVPGDFDGDSKTDYAVWRPSNGVWYVIRSTDHQVTGQQWGLPGDVPVSGDFDGDGKTDYAVWRASIGTWFIIPSGDSLHPIWRQWGLPGDIPVAGDFDGDLRTDFAVWRPGSGYWYVIPSGDSSNPLIRQWGLPGDSPM
jgi:hypothetical protein